MTTKEQDAIVRKESDFVILTNDLYRTPNTSLMLFHFEPHVYLSSKSRLNYASIVRTPVEGKDVYLFDDFFSLDESALMRDFTTNATFSRSSYGSAEGKEAGEKAARSMNNKEKWEFFIKPPQPIKEIYKLLSTLAQELNADITTLPWDLCDQKLCASAVATNRVESATKESMEMGKHEDFNTEKGLPFGIPILYAKENEYYPSNFVNGDPGKPWLVSFMLYVTEENFECGSYGLGTVFYTKNGVLSTRADAKHMRFVIFEGDILHSIEESHIPPDVHTWRVSYVFKLIINPRSNEEGSMRTKLAKLLNL